MHSAIAALALILFTVANISTLYLYTYPIFRGCAFPSPPAQALPTPRQTAPFRLLVFGDPQLEGDSSLPDYSFGYFPSLHDVWPSLRAASFAGRLPVLWRVVQALVNQDLPLLLYTYRKKLDLLGNDFYLAHIYRTLHWSTNPTHVAVLGDLLGSQWISDEEFERRGERYWGRVFHGGERVEDEITDEILIAPLGMMDEAWKRRIINVAGNHDIGYAGDMTAERITRFERVFGKVNWETRFQLSSRPPPLDNNDDTTPRSEEKEGKESPELRLIILNSLNLDTPALDPSLQLTTYNFLSTTLAYSPPASDHTSATILLTHLPLHKPSGTCTDPPHIAYHHHPDHGAGIREQNHLSPDTSTHRILEGLFSKTGIPDGRGGGLGRAGVILTGHDHEGCDVYHHLPNAGSLRHWEAGVVGGIGNGNATTARRMMAHGSVPGVREITVRSMMGEFGGNAGLLSAWWEGEGGEHQAAAGWRFEYRACAVGKQHFWWAVHVLDGAVALFLAVVVGKEGWGRMLSAAGRGKGGKEKVS